MKANFGMCFIYIYKCLDDFNKHLLLSVYQVPGTMLDGKDTVMNTCGPCHLAAQILQRGQDFNK